SAVDRVQERNVVNVLADVREDFRHLDAALPVLLEAERARHQRTGKSLADDDITLHLAVDRLARVFRERRLRIEGVHMTPAAAHEERNDGRRPWLEVR